MSLFDDIQNGKYERKQAKSNTSSSKVEKANSVTSTLSNIQSGKYERVQPETIADKMNQLWVEDTPQNNNTTSYKATSVKDFVNSINKELPQPAAKTPALPNNNTYKPVNVKDFVDNINNKAVVEAGYDPNNFSLKEKALLNSGNYSVNPNYDPKNKYSKKVIYTGNVLTNKDVDPTLGQKLSNTVERTGRTAMDFVGNVATGVTQAGEGLVDATVANTGNYFSNLTSVGGLLPNKVSEGIRQGTENFVKGGITSGMRQMIDEDSQKGSGIYNPKILGLPVRNAVQEIARMYTTSLMGGLPTMMLSAAGNSTEQALNEGQKLNNAVNYGNVAGAIEGATEKMFDAPKLFGGGLISKLSGKMSNTFASKILEATVGEGIEEVVSESINPFVKMLTYEGKVENPFGSKENFWGYLHDIGVAGYQGALIGALTLGTSAPNNIELQKAFSNDVYKALDKVQGIDQVRKNEIANKIIEGAKTVTGEDVKNIRSFVENYKKNAGVSEYLSNDFKNNINSTIQNQNVQGLPKNSLRERLQSVQNNTGNEITPGKIQAPQNANMNAETQNTVKQRITNTINNNSQLTAEEKQSLLQILEENSNNLTPDAVNFFNDTINNLQNNRLEQVTDKKATYKKYLNDKTELDKTALETAKNSVPANKSGRRTKEQWLKVANTIGQQIYDLNDSEIERYAYKSWQETHPNQANNLNRQGKGFVKFTSDEWIDAITKSAQQAKAQTQVSQVNNVLPTERSQATLESAKQVGMTDIDVKKANDLNNLLRSGAKLVFYDESNMPKVLGPQSIDKAKIANGFYYNGTVYINKNSPKKVQQILGHELTHHTENSSIYNDMAKYIKNSNAFYEYISSKGYNSIEEYKADLKERGYSNKDFDREMVAEFCENNLFNTQESIDRLARENRTLAQKIKNWISDMLANFKGTTVEKELRKIENMYNKALNEASNNPNNNSVSYMLYGTKGISNLINSNNQFNKLYLDFQKAVDMANNGASNEEIWEKTKWFKGKKDRKWRFEIPDMDKYFDFKTNKIEEGKVLPLSQIIYHPFFEAAYPAIYNSYKVQFKKMAPTIGGEYDPNTGILTINSNIKTSDIKAILLHEMQHTIQEYEGFEKGTDTKRGKKKYFESVGETEAEDVKQRYLKGNYDTMPESGKDNPKHPGYDSYMKKRGFADKVIDTIYDKFEGGVEIGTSGRRRRYAIRETSIQNVPQQNKNISQNRSQNTNEVEQNLSKQVLNTNIAGDKPAFSLPQNIVNPNFEQQVDDFAKGTLNKKNSLVLLENTPKILQDLGVKDLPITVTANKLERIMNKEGKQLKEYHDLGADIVKQLPEALQRPLNILKSYNNSYVLITELADKQDRPIIASIKIDGQGKIDNIEFDSNVMTSAYGRNDYDKYMQRNIAEGNMVYDIDEGIIKENLTDGAGLQLSRTTNKVSNNSISQNESSVNTEYAQENKKDTAGDKPAFSLPSTDSQGRTLSKQQQEYFKDSKVRDEKGNLLAMYHGTPNGTYTVFKDGSYFSPRKEYADGYKNTWASAISTKQEASNPKTYEVYLNITNPFTIQDSKAKNIYINEFIKGGNSLSYDPYTNWTEDINQLDEIDWTEAEDLREWLQENHPEYDGLILDEGGDGGYGEAEYRWRGKSFVPFSANQIKNVDNTNPTANEDIRYSIKDDIDKLNEEYGSIKPGENPARDVKIPKKTGKNQYVSQYARTLAESEVTTPETLNLIEKDVVEGRLSHEKVTDKKALTWAENYINENGWEDSIKDWDSWIKSGKQLDKDQLALGQLIYNNAVQAKDAPRVMKMIGDLVAEFSETGRSLQAARLLKRMTPDGRLYALERSVAKINQDLQKQISDFTKDKKVTISEELAKELLEAKTPKEVDIAVEKIQEHIADQVPPTWTDKLNAWRYLAMLGNPRTHIRNIAGNALMIPVKNLKNEIGTVLEKTLPKEQRTKAILNPLSATDNALKSFAANDFDQNAEMVRGESKYDIKAGIKEKQRIFSTEPLERLRKANFNALEAEDAFFLKMHYAEAFAEALKARGITVEDARNGTAEMSKTLAEIREIATNEAQKATYRDFNKWALIVAHGKNRTKNFAASAETVLGKAVGGFGNLALEGALPFAKTPLNIVRRGIEYSPIGLATGIGDAFINVKKGNVTAAQAIDEISAGLSGTAIVGLGMLLAKLGLVSGGDNEDKKERYFEEMTGLQSYSLKLGKYNYTIDWSAPASMPLFVGVEIWNAMQKENADFEDVLTAFSKISEPVFELSMLQGINNIIKQASYGDNAIGSIFTNMGKSYVSQYNPTVLGQVARTIDDTRRTTYEDKNKSFSKLRKFGQQQLQKIPFANQTLLPRYDQFGRKDVDTNVLRRAFENFISPGYISEDKSTTVENELSRVYKQTGEKGVLPSYAAKKVTVNGKEINFTQKQYEEFTVTRGQTAYEQLSKMFETNQYKKLSDKDKQELIEDVYKYATEYAKSKVTDYEFSKTTKDGKAYTASQHGINPYQYLMTLQTADTDNNGYVSQKEFESAIKKSNLTAQQRAYLIGLNKTKK